MTAQSVQIKKTVRHALERSVAASARAMRLFAQGDHLLVAVSGGPDSVALLAVLASLTPSWRLRLSALHVNYGLRGEESEEDERFVSRLCAGLGVPLVCERVNLHRADGLLKGLSLQARAREARYAALRRVAVTLGADKIALGHTADDQAETLLMWMLRGSGTAGLAGIRPVREGLYVRPLLGASRADVLAYLKARGLTFRTDSSNAKPLYLRNRVRRDLLPLLKEFNPAVVDALTRQAAILRDEDLCLEQWTLEWIGRHVQQGAGRTLTVPRAELLALPLALQRRVVREVVKQVTRSGHGPTFGAAESVLEKVVQGRSGSSLALRGARVTREYGAIICSGLGAPPPAGRTIEIGHIPSTTVWPATGQRIRIRMMAAGTTGLADGRHIAQFDADRFTHRLVLRSWKPGDMFHPQGMGGRRKKVQDYFCDSKLPRGRRPAVPLLVAPEGILWIAGLRTDHRFHVTPSTKRIVAAELLPADVMTGGKD
jgi:tRNA(Ile)-lysidine synthase